MAAALAEKAKAMAEAANDMASVRKAAAAAVKVMAAVETGDDLKIAAEAAEAVKAKASAVAEVAAELAKVHELGSVKAIKELIDDKGDERYVRAVVTGVPSLRCSQAMLDELDKVTHLRWGVQNKDTLRLITRAALPVNNTLTLTIPKLRKIPASRMYRKHLRENGIRLAEVGEEVGGDFEEAAKKIGDRLQRYGNKFYPKGSPTLLQLEQDVVEFFDAEVKFQ